MKIAFTVPRMTLICLLQISLILALSRTSLHATLFNVDFNGGYSSYVDPTQTGPAVIGNAGDIWNGFSNLSGNKDLLLLGANGSSSSVKLTFFEDMAYLYYDGPNGQYDGKLFENLMTAFVGIDANDKLTITLTGFVPSSLYSLYIYTGGDAGSNDADNTSTWNVNGGPSKTNISSRTVSELIEGKNYLNLTGNTNLAGEIILVGAAGNNETYVFGFQLEATSSPQEPIDLRAITRTANGNVGLTIPTVKDEKYRVQSSSSLVAGSWEDTGITRIGLGLLAETLTVPPVGTESKKFYRVGTTPDDIDSLTAVSHSNSTMLLTWANLATESGYEVQWANNADFTAATTLPVFSDNTVSTSVTGLSPNTKHFFRIRALKNGGLPTPFSPITEATTKETIPFPLVSVGGTIRALSVPVDVDVGAANAASYGTDGSIATKWTGDNETTDGTWLEYTFASSKSYVIKGFTLYTANDEPERHPSEFKLQGFANGGTTWVDLEGSAFTGQIQEGEGLPVDYDCSSNTTAYPKVRFLITDNNGNQYYVQVAELKLFGVELIVP